MRQTAKIAIALVVASSFSLIGGCMLLDVRAQQARMRQACAISGQVTTARPGANPLVVVLVARDQDQGAVGAPWRVLDYHVAHGPGAWAFTVGPGAYRTAAFEDVNGDLVYQPGEAFAGANAEDGFECIAGEHRTGVVHHIPVDPLERFDRTLDIVALQSLAPRDQATRALAQLTAVGELGTLSDPRFSQENAESSLWRPYDYIVSSRPGVYFLEPYDPQKLPVLFVHGINGTPVNFTYLIDQLDRSRFQPWVYSFPSGVHLEALADHLSQTLAKLQAQHRVERLIVVAHSMGGLVSRGFLLRRAAHAQFDVPLFVTISTPWEGHAAAELGVKHAPVVVDVWRDMAPGSEYLRSLFTAQLPASTAHHLIFTYARKAASFGVSDDQTVTVASQLAHAAQREAVRMHGFDDTHDGILRNAEIAALLNELLAAQTAMASSAHAKATGNP